MILGVDELLKLVKEQKLVEGLCERELTNPEGSGFDLRLGKVWETSGEGYLGIEERKTTEIKLLAEYQEGEKTLFEFKPGRQYIVTMVEKVNMPENLTANFWLRGTMYRNGFMMSNGNIAPGYHGELTVTLFNCSQNTTIVEMGARIAHILFYEIKGTANLYRGQWQNGRIATNVKEKQV